MKRIAYIIPGHEETHLKQRGYDKVANFFTDKGIEPIHVEIDWHNTNPADFTTYKADFLRQFKKPKGKSEVYILGFSYGAVIAFLTETRTKPKALILCSLSPYFDEDLDNLKPQWKRWWQKNFVNSNYSFNDLVPKIKTKTYLIVGDQEHISCIKRAKDAKKRIKNSSLIIAKGAKHKMGQKEYLETVKKIIAKF
jgi:pimeloyl-ACP methyl ester carboxylesterase